MTGLENAFISARCLWRKQVLKSRSVSPLSSSIPVLTEAVVISAVRLVSRVYTRSWLGRLPGQSQDPAKGLEIPGATLQIFGILSVGS